MSHNTQNALEQTRQNKYNNSDSSDKEFLTIRILDQLFGIPILQVQDVLGEQRITKIPLAPIEVAGSLNLRGRIVTAIDVRTCLGIPQMENRRSIMSVVVEHEGELYSLIIDSVGDVLSLSDESFEASPTTLDAQWKSLSVGVYRLESKLLVVLDVPKLLESMQRHLN